MFDVRHVSGDVEEGLEVSGVSNLLDLRNFIDVLLQKLSSVFYQRVLLTLHYIQQRLVLKLVRTLREIH